MSLKDQSAEGASSAEDQGEDLYLPRTNGGSSCVDDEGSRRIPASAESYRQDHHIDGRGSRKDLRPQGSAAGSTTSSEEEQQTDHSRRTRGSRGSSSSEEQRTKLIHVDPEDREDLHRQRSGADVFYIHRYQVVVFLVITISLRCSLGLFRSGVGSVWVCLNTGSSVLVDCKFGSEAVDEGDSEVVCRDQQQDQPHRRKTIKEGSSYARISSRINHIIVGGSRRASTSSDGEREVVHFGIRTYRTSSTIRSRSYISSLWTDCKRKATRVCKRKST